MVEGGSFSKCGVRVSAARGRFKHLQGLHGLRAGSFQNVVPATASHTLACNMYKSSTGSPHQRIRIGASEMFRVTL
eukprot:3724522-Pyramimonas_sp.AAC.1